MSSNSKEAVLVIVLPRSLATVFSTRALKVMTTTCSGGAHDFWIGAVEFHFEAVGQRFQRQALCGQRDPVDFRRERGALKFDVGRQHVFDHRQPIDFAVRRDFRGDRVIDQLADRRFFGAVASWVVSVVAPFPASRRW